VAGWPSPTHSFKDFSAHALSGGTFVRRLRDCRKILIPYGDTARTMKLLNGQLVGRFIGHQNFTTASEDA